MDTRVAYSLDIIIKECMLMFIVPIVFTVKYIYPLLHTSIEYRYTKDKRRGTTRQSFLSLSQWQIKVVVIYANFEPISRLSKSYTTLNPKNKNINFLISIVNKTAGLN